MFWLVVFGGGGKAVCLSGDGKMKEAVSVGLWKWVACFSLMCIEWKSRRRGRGRHTPSLSLRLPPSAAKDACEACETRAENAQQARANNQEKERDSQSAVEGCEQAINNYPQGRGWSSQEKEEAGAFNAKSNQIDRSRLPRRFSILLYYDVF